MVNFQPSTVTIASLPSQEDISGRRETEKCLVKTLPPSTKITLKWGTDCETAVDIYGGTDMSPDGFRKKLNVEANLISGLASKLEDSQKELERQRTGKNPRGRKNAVRSGQDVRADLREIFAIMQGRIGATFWAGVYADTDEEQREAKLIVLEMTAWYNSKMGGRTQVQLPFEAPAPKFRLPPSAIAGNLSPQTVRYGLGPSFTMGPLAQSGVPEDAYTVYQAATIADLMDQGYNSYPTANVQLAQEHTGPLPIGYDGLSMAPEYAFRDFDLPQNNGRPFPDQVPTGGSPYHPMPILSSDHLFGNGSGYWILHDEATVASPMVQGYGAAIPLLNGDNGLFSASEMPEIPEMDNNGIWLPYSDASGSDFDVIGL